VEKNDIIPKVMVDSTFVSDKGIQEWWSNVVMALNGTIYNKQNSLKSIHNPAGMIVSSTPLPMDCSHGMQGKSRHGGKIIHKVGY
jgi:hypothetical protein